MAEGGGMVRRLKQGAAIAGAATLLGAKVYLGEKYLNWRAQRKRAQAGVGIGPSKFAGLSRARQSGILSYKRSQVRDLEGVYYGPGHRRRGGAGGGVAFL